MATYDNAYTDMISQKRSVTQPVAIADTAYGQRQQALAPVAPVTPEPVATQETAYAERAGYMGTPVGVYNPWTGVRVIDNTPTTPAKSIDLPAPPVVPSQTEAMDKVLVNKLQSYGMEGVATSVANIRRDYPEISSDDLLTLLKQDTRYNSAYLTRFAGNATLAKAGKQTLDDATYLKAEQEYEKIFKAYGVDNLANRSQYATLIGNSMDAVDVSKRIQIGYNRLKADPNVEASFRQYYPGISNGDIVSAMLNPEEMLPALERKAAAAEIGGAALQQELKVSKVRAEELAALGVDKTQAQAGYNVIARKTPRGEFLSQISQETGINYGQQTAEDIQFKKDIKAQEKEAALVNKELARFAGSTGRLASKDRAQGLI